MLRSPKTQRGLAPALLAAVFAILLAVSWQQWTNLIIDSGREMNAPLRLLQGERLYSDVYYLYGPLAPYVNAALYAMFGAHLNTLYAAGTAAAILTVILVFRLGERLSGTWEAALAAWAVTVLCVFKPGGSYIFPYAYAAVYGNVIGLASLLTQVDYVHRRRPRSLPIAGLLAGLAGVCKLEFGFAAMAGLLALAATERAEDRLRTLGRTLVPAVLLAAGIYAVMISMASWNAVMKDTFLWPPTIPADLVYFNRSKLLGFSDPSRTFRELVSAIADMGLLGVLVVVAAAWTTAGSLRGGLDRLSGRSRRAVVWIGAASLAVLAVNIAVFRTRWDVSPLRALPVLSLAAIYAFSRPSTHRWQQGTLRRSIVIVSVYAFVVLGRVITRVPSGGAYGAQLLPVPLVLFTYFATAFYRPAFEGMPAFAARARQIALVLLVLSLSAATVVIAHRYRTREAVRLATWRGAMRVPPEVASGFEGALALIDQSTQPGDFVWAVPEGSSLNFLSGRRTPSRYEIFTPGFLDENAERTAVGQLEARRPALVLLVLRPMREFRCEAFGRDCYRTLMGWIDANYEAFAEFGRGPDGSVITAYRPKTR